MITLQTLENTSTEELLEAFTLSFSDYVVPFSLTREQLESKLKSDSIRLEFSAGAFEDNQLVAFVLHGYDVVDGVKVAYNAGTGVIPSKRGNKLTARLYEFALPILEKNTIEKVVLEVINTNGPAIAIYGKIGFKTIRQFNCLKGTINAVMVGGDFEIRTLDAYDWTKLRSFWDLNPSWQNSITAVENLKPVTVSIGIYENGNLSGYAIFNPGTKKIYQLSVDKNRRKRGIGRQLLGYIAEHYGKDFSAINVDDVSEGTLQFMEAIGMTVYIRQYEMELQLR